MPATEAVAMIEPLPAGPHDLGRVLDGQIDADQIYTQHLGPLLRRLLEEGREAADDTRVGVADVQATKLRNRSAHRRLDVGFESPRRRSSPPRSHRPWRMAAAVSSTLSTLSKATTLAPSAANSLALARPMPLAAPVTRAIRSRRRDMYVAPSNGTPGNVAPPPVRPSRGAV